MNEGNYASQPSNAFVDEWTRAGKASATSGQLVADAGGNRNAGSSKSAATIRNGKLKSMQGNSRDSKLKSALSQGVRTNAYETTHYSTFYVKSNPYQNLTTGD